MAEFAIAFLKAYLFRGLESFLCKIAFIGCRASCLYVRDIFSVLEGKVGRTIEDGETEGVCTVQESDAQTSKQTNRNEQIKTSNASSFNSARNCVDMQ